MTARSLYFVEPNRVEVRERPVPDPGPGELLVQTRYSAVSSGTELLVYRGEVPDGMALDETIDALDDGVSYPLKYGYAAVGTVEAVGAGVDDSWLDRDVFAFNPHESHFLAETSDLQVLPEGVRAADATLLPTVETAANLVMDGRPGLGERVVVFGQGTVGLTLTAVLSRFPLESLVAVDPDPDARERALPFGADEAFSPEGALERLAPEGSATATGEGVDLSFEASGNPAALDDAVAVTGFDGRVVVGSWYGTRRASLELGGRFHRGRVDIRSSQVSTVAPALRGRWDKERRLGLAWDLLADIEVRDLLTLRVPLDAAPEVYEDLSAGHVDGILFTYG
jgi:2-desacetyl-2-hydroxyethyl bacteriochlorophyllide A dehydrogenase